MGVIGLLAAFTVKAQPDCIFRHYSFNEGLPQATITDIIQDKRGCIWLGTFDGLVRYDGYEFRSFKVLSSSYSITNSNRVDHIHEDKFGRFWIESFGDVYCFNPMDQSFIDIPQIKGYRHFSKSIEKIEIMASGRVWLLHKQYGALCITDSLFNYTSYPLKDSSLMATRVYAVYEDTDKNTWLLTENGLGFIGEESGDDITFTFQNDGNRSNPHRPFFSAYETDDNIWFGSYKGEVWQYSKSAKTYREIKLDTRSNITRFLPLNTDTIVLLTASDGFFTYSHSSKEFRHFNGDNITDFDTENLHALHVEGADHIWFSTKSMGISKFDFNTRQLKRFTVDVNDNTVADNPQQPFVVKDKNGHLWVHPRGGGFSFYDKQKDQLVPFYSGQGNADNQNPSIVKAALVDQQGNLWYALKSVGLQKVSFNKKTSLPPLSLLCNAVVL